MQFLNSLFLRVFGRTLTPQIEVEPVIDPRDIELEAANARILELAGLIGAEQDARLADRTAASAEIDRLVQEVVRLRGQCDRLTVLRNNSIPVLHSCAGSLGGGIQADNPGNYRQGVKDLIVFVLNNELDLSMAFYPYVTQVALKVWVDHQIGHGALEEGRVGTHTRPGLFALLAKAANDGYEFKRLGGRPDQPPPN